MKEKQISPEQFTEEIIAFAKQKSENEAIDNARRVSAFYMRNESKVDSWENGLILDSWHPDTDMNQLMMVVKKAKKEKLINRLLDIPSDFRYVEMVTLLKYFGFNEKQKDNYQVPE